MFLLFSLFFLSLAKAKVRFYFISIKKKKKKIRRGGTRKRNVHLFPYVLYKELGYVIAPNRINYYRDNESRGSFPSPNGSLGSAKWQSILMALRTVKYYTHMSG
jgi:hypothetical protein